ncbi:hypothetical protein SK128_014616 [Halocaridina rubra]|uniref:Hexosyltransferase n=1 Tax=Halocaridina rubra TaxID=373956 RepID=A0AAN9A1X0_HALRR
MEKDEHVYLLIVLLYYPEIDLDDETSDPFKKIKDLTLKYNRKYQDSGSKVGWMAVQTLKHLPSDFAIMDLVIKKYSEDTIVFFTRHSPHFTNDFLNRVRMNTIHKWQVFSPVPFTLYHPSAVEENTSYQKLEVNRNVGHFDSLDFDHISFYIADYIAARKVVAETIPFIRVQADLRHDHPEEYEFNIYGLFLRASNLHVLRASEPSLKFEYRDIKCESNHRLQSEQQHSTCVLQRETSLGLRSQLSKLVLRHIERKESNLNLN